jgi:hypothetical protein
MAKNEPEQYATFWKEFGQVLKEGPAEDFANKEKIAGLLRFSTTHTDQETQDQSLADYVGRMQEGQDKIYYVVAENFNTARRSPQLEVFRKRGIEVLLLSDRVDDWLMNHLQEFDGKQFQDVARGGSISRTKARRKRRARGGGKGVRGPDRAHQGRAREACRRTASDAPADRLTGLPGGRRVRHGRADAPDHGGCRSAGAGQQADAGNQSDASADPSRWTQRWTRSALPARRG